MSNVCVIRHQGYIKSKAHLPYQHNFRTAKNYTNTNIDSSLTKNNTTMLFNLQKDETYLRAFNRLYEGKEFQGQLKVQGGKDKQTKFFDEFLIYPPYEIINAMSIPEQNAFFKEEIKALREYFPNMILLSANIHRDEHFQPMDESMKNMFPEGKITPHMHVTAIPVVLEKKTGIKKISISQLWHGINSYGKFQDFMFKSVGEKYKFERGEIHELGKSQKHLDVETFKKQEKLKSLDKQEAIIKQKEKELKKRAESIEPKTNISFLNIKSVIQEQIGINFALEKANEDILILKQENAALAKKVNETKSKCQTLHIALLEKENELEEEISLTNEFLNIKTENKSLRHHYVKLMLSHLQKYKKLAKLVNDSISVLKSLCPEFYKEVLDEKLLEDEEITQDDDDFKKGI